MNRSRLQRYRVVSIAVVAMLVIVAAVAIYRHEHETSETPGRTAMAMATASTSSTSSTASMAGMNMSGDGSVTMTPTQFAQFGVTFGTVERRMLTNDIRTVGTVVVDESRTASVTSKVDGYVEHLYVNVTGQPVRAGQPVAEIYSPDLVAAQDELLLARRLDRTIGESAVPGVPSSSADLLDAAKRRLRLLDISEAQIDDVLRTGKTRRTFTLYSPATGVVVEKNVVQGQAIRAGTELLAVADLSDVWIDIQLREADGGLVRVGTPADVELASYPGRTYKGRVAFVYPTLTEQTRTIRARITVANADGRLKPGMYGTVHLLAPTRMATTVPRTAIVQTGTRTLVFVDMGSGKLMPRDVVVGRVVGDLAEVLSGLDVGQRVVTSAQFLIDSESNLAAVMRSMIGSGMPGAGGGDMKGMDTGNAKGADMRGMPGMVMPAAPTGGSQPPAPARPPR